MRMPGNGQKIRGVMLAAWLAVAGLSVAVALGQNTTSSIAGTIEDPSGAVVPNARITIRHDATGQVIPANRQARGIHGDNIPPRS